MRTRHAVWLGCAAGFAALLFMSACAAHAPLKSQAAYQETPMPTVPPGTPTPEPSSAPLPTRGVRKAVKSRPGAPIGPVVTYFGAATADGHVVQPLSVDKQCIATYKTLAGSGFILVVEAKPGESGLDPGRSVF